MLRASVKRFSRACTTPFALSADRSNSQTDFCGKGPLFLERVTCSTSKLKNFNKNYKGLGTTETEKKEEETQTG